MADADFDESASICADLDAFLTASCGIRANEAMVAQASVWSYGFG